MDNDKKCFYVWVTDDARILNKINTKYISSQFKVKNLYYTIWIDGCSLDVGIVSITPKPFLHDNIGSKQNSLQAQQKNEAIF